MESLEDLEELIALGRQKMRGKGPAGAFLAPDGPCLTPLVRVRCRFVAAGTPGVELTNNFPDNGPQARCQRQGAAGGLEHRRARGGSETGWEYKTSNVYV